MKSYRFPTVLSGDHRVTKDAIKDKDFFTFCSISHCMSTKPELLTLARALLHLRCGGDTGMGIITISFHQLPSIGKARTFQNPIRETGLHSLSWLRGTEGRFTPKVMTAIYRPSLLSEL